MKTFTKTLIATLSLVLLSACSTNNQAREDVSLDKMESTTLAQHDECEMASYHRQFRGCKAHQ
jgi:uncharacterized lipoprotein